MQRGASMCRRCLLSIALAAACAGGRGREDAFDEPDGSPPPGADAAPAAPGSVEITVDGDTAWTRSAVSVRRGELVRVIASGSIAFDGETEVGPAGFGPDDNDQYNAVGCADHAALIARVAASGGGFAVADEERLLAPRAGELAFGPNDTRTGDNTGAFTVVIEPKQPLEIVEKRSVTVAGNATWIDTGIDVIPDHMIAIDADGRVDNNAPDEVDYGPEGMPDSANDPYSILACADHMSLIGKVSVDGAPFLVGRDLSRPAAASGRLFLRVNHREPGGNTGKFSASVLVAR